MADGRDVSVGVLWTFMFRPSHWRWCLDHIWFAADLQEQPAGAAL